MFVKNVWYVAGLSSELTRQPFRLVLLDVPVVLFRLLDGRPVAMEDRCCHRGAPLSMGRLIDDDIECGYHGMRFAADGRCVKIPGQSNIPPAARVPTYPLVEQDGLIWIWMGDPECAAHSQPIAMPWRDMEGVALTGGRMLVRTNHEMLYDNLLDPSHLGYVHRRTIGGGSDDPESHARAERKIEPLDNGLKVRRLMLDVDPPPTYRKYWPDFIGRIDRWNDMLFHPGMVIGMNGAVAACGGPSEEQRAGGYHMFSLHGITPETTDTTNYVWYVGHNGVDADGSVIRAFHDDVKLTFEEDIGILEAQYDNIRRDPTRRMISMRVDEAGLRARRFWKAARRAKMAAE